MHFLFLFSYVNVSECQFSSVYIGLSYIILVAARIHRILIHIRSVGVCTYNMYSLIYRSVSCTHHLLKHHQNSDYIFLFSLLPVLRCAPCLCPICFPFSLAVSIPSLVLCRRSCTSFSACSNAILICLSASFRK